MKTWSTFVLTLLLILSLLQNIKQDRQYQALDREFDMLIREFNACTELTGQAKWEKQNRQFWYNFFDARSTQDDGR